MNESALYQRWQNLFAVKACVVVCWVCCRVIVLRSNTRLLVSFYYHHFFYIHCKTESQLKPEIFFMMPRHKIFRTLKSLHFRNFHKDVKDISGGISSTLISEALSSEESLE